MSLEWKFTYIRTSRELWMEFRGAAIRFDGAAGDILHVMMVAEGHAHVEAATRTEHFGLNRQVQPGNVGREGMVVCRVARGMKALILL